MGRPPSHGVPAFRFNNAEVAEMEAMLQANNTVVPAREVLEALAQRFSTSPERSGKFVVQMKQVWNWFQNRRYAIRARTSKTPVKLTTCPSSRDDSAVAKNVAQAPQPQHQQPQHPQPQHPQPQHHQPQHPQPQHPQPQPPQPHHPQPQHLQPQHPQPQPASLVTVRNVPQAPPNLPPPAGKNAAESTPMEFEAKSARDGAWYDVASFLSHRNLETGNPEVLVRFAGFGAEEDEWVDIRRHVRQRSLPCESSECVAVLPGDLVLCFQEGKEQALYFDAHVLDSQRRRHDIRGCRCRFLVRYDHDQSEEIVPLRKICRRPETDHRLQLLHALNDSATAKQPKSGIESRTTSTLRVYPPPEVTEKQLKKEEPVAVIHMVPATSKSNLVAGSETKNQQPNVSEIVDAGPVKIPNAPPGSGIQLLEAPGFINPVNQKDPNELAGNDAAIQDSADKAATAIGDPNATLENDAVLNEVDVNNGDANIEGNPNVTPETDDVLNEAATNIEEDVNGTPENHAVLNEDAANTEEETNGAPEDEAVSNEDGGNIEGETNGMLEDEADLNEDAAANIEGDRNGTPEDVVVLNEGVTDPILTMNWRWKEEYSDLMLVPTGLLIMLSYHLILLFRYLKFPHTTVIGCEDHYKRVWVEKTLQLDAKDRATAIAVINSNIIASTNMTSVSLVLSSLIGTWIGSSSGKTILSSSVIYGDTRMTITSYKYISLLSCFLVAFASFVQMSRNYTLAAFLLSMPHCEIPVSYVQKPVIKGSNYWVIGLRALYFAAILIMWIFGPISMFISSVIMVAVLHNQDTTSTEPYLFRSGFRYQNNLMVGEELVAVNRAFGHQQRTM